MQVLLTLGTRKKLEKILKRERRHNPDAVFRIWEITTGRYDDARICLRLALDNAAEDDERTVCCEIPFVAAREFLELRGEPHIFCVLSDEYGNPIVEEFTD